jgi:hypothetical protein
MTKNQTPEFFLQKIQDANSDTTQLRWLAKAEATLSAEDYAELVANLQHLGL